MTTGHPMSNEGKKVAETQIHAMCAYIRGQKCNECPASVDTLYGNGQPGCHAIAEETLLKARSLLSDPASQVGRMPSVDELAQIIRRVDGNHDKGASALADAILAALAISPPVKCERCGGSGDHCPDINCELSCESCKGTGERPDCSQPKASQVGKVHDLKTWPGYFIAMLEGRKTFELRRDDRGFTVGDTLLLREFEPSTCEYTGRELRREITHILRGPMFGLNVGHAILSLRQSRDASNGSAQNHA